MEVYKKMSEKENTTGENWDGLLTNYLKADNLTEPKEKFVCIGFNIKDKDMDLELERKGTKYIFSLNVTNKLFLKNSGLKSPNSVVGKVITLKKVLATNPTTRKEVDSLRIDAVDEE